MKYTNEQLEQIVKSMNDIEYFADNFIQIPSRTESTLQKITLNDYQRDFIRNFNEGKPFFSLGRRMAGKTTAGAIILLHQALFKEQRVSVIAAPKKQNSDEVIRLIGDMYDNLPDFMKFGVSRRNTSSIEFSNYTRIVSVGQNYDRCRGMTIHNIFIDESEFFKDLRIFVSSIWPCVGIINDSRLFAASSTVSHDLLEKMVA